MKKILFILLLIPALVFGQATGFVIADKPSGGAIGTAASTVDIATLFNLTQTTAGQTLTVPNLTNASAGKIIYINNKGSVTTTLSPGGVLPVGFGVVLRWEGVRWSVCGLGSISANATNPTSGFIPYNNSGVFSDSWLSQDADNIFIENNKKISSPDGTQFIQFTDEPSLGSMWEATFGSGTPRINLIEDNLELEYGSGQITIDPDGTVRLRNAGGKGLVQVEDTEIYLQNTDGLGDDAAYVRLNYDYSIIAKTYDISPGVTGASYVYMDPIECQLMKNDGVADKGKLSIKDTSFSLFHTDKLEFDAPVYKFPQLAASRVPYLDASKNLVSSAVTPTELGYVSGVTSPIQAQIDAKGAGTLTSIATTAPVLGGTITSTGTISVDTSKSQGRLATYNDVSLKLNKTDTTSLSNRINLKLAKTDTASLSNRINLKLAKTDTASLSTRINSKQAALGFTPENAANKNATGGYPGLSGFDLIVSKDIGGGTIVSSLLVSGGTSPRTYTFQNRSGTVADNTDLALKADIASPTFTGTVTIPTPFTLGATSVTSTGTRLNYLTAATGTTGTTSTNLVFSGSPTIATPSFTTNITTPLILGGTGTTQTLTYQTTSGVGASGANHLFKVGNNGATTAMTILNSGMVGVGISPTSPFHVGATAGGNGGITQTLLANGLASISYSTIDFNVPTTGLIGQFLATASNYNNSNAVAPNSVSLLAEATSGQLSLGAIGASGYVSFITGGIGTSNERARFISSGQFGLGVTAPTATLHLKAGTATASTAPLKFTSGTNLTTAEAGAVEYDGAHFFISPSTTRYQVAQIFIGSATLDFGSTLAGASSDLTLTVTGAADGDVVSIGVPNGSTLANGCFTAWVSATNTVTIRFTNNSLTLALDPASGTFKAAVNKN